MLVPKIRYLWYLNLRTRRRRPVLAVESICLGTSPLPIHRVTSFRYNCRFLDMASLRTFSYDRRDDWLQVADWRVGLGR